MKYIALTLLIPLLVLSGCSYNVGPTNRTVYKDVKKVFVPVSRNESFDPGFQVILTDAIINRINEDGTFENAEQGAQDATLKTVIEKVDRNAIRFAAQNALVAQEFELLVTVKYQFISSSGKVIREGTKVGKTQFYSGNDLIAAQRQAMPLALQNAAYQIVSSLAEAW